MWAGGGGGGWGGGGGDLTLNTGKIECRGSSIKGFWKRFLSGIIFLDWANRNGLKTNIF